MCSVDTCSLVRVFQAHDFMHALSMSMPVYILAVIYIYIVVTPGPLTHPRTFEAQHLYRVIAITS